MKKNDDDDDDVMTRTAMKSQRRPSEVVIVKMVLMKSIEEAAAEAKESRTESSFKRNCQKLRGIAKTSASLKNVLCSCRVCKFGARI